MMTKRILLCDDEPHILRAAEIKLQRAGFEIQTAHDGLEGWEIIQAWRPDCVVTDYQMPRLDGLGLVMRCRQHAQTQHLPILMLTAKGFELSRQELFEKWRVCAILPKPFSPRELLACVQEIVETGHCHAAQHMW